jgi:hypothetical protein
MVLLLISETPSGKLLNVGFFSQLNTEITFFIEKLTEAKFCGEKQKYN